MSKPTILTLCDYYLPGYKAGGPIKSVSNLVGQLGTKCHFRIVTRDRDRDDNAAYSVVSGTDWQTVGRAEVKYLPPGRALLRGVRDVLSSFEFDVLYVNSCFSSCFSVWPLLLRRWGRDGERGVSTGPATAMRDSRWTPPLLPGLPGLAERPVVVAPRGELAPGALAQKRLKKAAFLKLARAMKLYDGVVWQASSSDEEKDIRAIFGDDARVVIAPNVESPPRTEQIPDGWKPKHPAGISLLFLSRISPKKNLLGALSMLRNVTGNVTLDILGPLEDASYWSRCRALIDRLPPNVRVRYRGAVPPEQVRPVMQQYDLFFLPTLSENYGHVIGEALSAGCPVLISDRTPWRNLGQAGAGWDVPLERPDLFQDVIQKCIAMTDAELRKLRQGALQYARRRQRENRAVQRNEELFFSLCARAGSDAPAARNRNAA